jgi:hypothetical protein
MSSDPLRLIKIVMAEVEEETRESVGDKFYVTWSEHISNWIELFQPVLRRLSEHDKLNLMIVPRLVELQHMLLWISMNVIYSRYHTAIREMRYLLDSMIQAHYLDTEHPDADIRCKLEILKEIDAEAFGSRLIDKTRLRHKQETKALYSDLSKYVHSSYEEMKPAILEGKVHARVTFSFDRELFDKCLKFTDRIMDVVYLVMLTQFPWLIETARSNQGLVDSFRMSDCKMALSLLENK